jgi:hypothetical protein
MDIQHQLQRLRPPPPDPSIIRTTRMLRRLRYLSAISSRAI